MLDLNEPDPNRGLFDLHNLHIFTLSGNSNIENIQCTFTLYSRNVRGFGQENLHWPIMKPSCCMADIDSSSIVLILMVGFAPIPSAVLASCPGGPSIESMSMSAPPASSPPPKSSWAETIVTITAATQFRQNKLSWGERDILATFTQTLHTVVTFQRITQLCSLKCCDGTQLSEPCHVISRSFLVSVLCHCLSLWWACGVPSSSRAWLLWSRLSPLCFPPVYPPAPRSPGVLADHISVVTNCCFTVYFN